MEAAGGAVKLEDRKAEGVEVSPSVSYAGEGLHDLCMGRTLGQAYDVFLQVAPSCVWCQVLAEARTCAMAILAGKID